MKLFLTLWFTVITSCIVAQKKYNLYVLDSLDRPAVTKDSTIALMPGHYFRYIEEPDSGSTNYQLIEYYLDKRIKRRGEISSIQPLVFEGLVMEYYPNGKKKRFQHYKNGLLLGAAYLYDENGKLNQERDYLPATFPLNPKRSDYKILSIYDTAGNKILDNGNGYIRHWTADSTFYEEGLYRDGLKDGAWKFIDRKKNYSRTEQYKSGLFISGISKLSDGIGYPYTEFEIMPSFNGGMQKFYEFVAKNYLYPEGAIRNGLSGKVIITFNVESDGALSDIKILKDLGFGTGEEAVRVLKKSPKWVPGIQFGYPARVSYTLPIMLNVEKDNEIPQPVFPPVNRSGYRF